MILWLLSNTCLAGLLALVVLAIGRWIRPSAAVMHALWLVVLLKLLSPVGLIWPVTVALPIPEQASQTDSENPTPPPPKDLEQSIPETSMEDLELVLLLHRDDVVLETSAQPPLVEVVSEPVPSPRASIWGIVLMVWIFGALVVGFRHVWTTWQFARTTKRARSAPEEVTQEVHYLARTLQIRGPVVRILRGLLSPVVWVLRKPVLFWPEQLETSLSCEGRKAVLIHELAHLRRGDHWVRWLEMIASILHWWNPFYWLVRRQIRLYCELACDSWVTQTFPETRRAYAEALLTVCSRTIRSTSPTPVMGISGDSRDLQRRLTMIMRDAQPCRLNRASKLALGFLTLAMLPGWILADEPTDTKKVEEIKKDVLIDLVPELDKELQQLKNIFIDLEGDVLKEIKVDLDVELQDTIVRRVQAQALSPDKEKKIKELEAKIQALTKELQTLKGNRTIEVRGIVTTEEKPKTTQLEGQSTKPNTRTIIQSTKPAVATVKREPTVEKQIKVIVIGEDGKETKDIKQAKEIKILIAPQGDATKPMWVTPKVKVIGEDGKEIKNIDIQVKPVIVPNVQGVKPMTITVPNTEGIKPMILEKLDTIKPMIMQKITEQKPNPTLKPVLAEKIAAQEKAIATWTKVKEATGTITLTRSTYKLSKESAEALEKFLKERVKADVLETKIDEKGLVVTTTPELQKSIGTIVSMMQEKTSSGDAAKQKLIEALQKIH